MTRLFSMTMCLGVLALALFSPAAQAEEQCPETLSHLSEDMDALLKGVHVKEFKRTMRSVLQASIPRAIRRADGIKAQMAFLRKEIQHQVRVEKSADFIARDVSDNPDGPLKPCKRPEETGYCNTVERYYMAKAANLANRAFLKALECYQRQGYQ
ncbi:MAG: hypothetical protein OXF97_07655 [Nitrospira sp.]|nr:hypothetical protein [Nitrospira sp.]